MIKESGGKKDRSLLMDDGLRYDLDLMESDPLLDKLKEWDYPIFDLLDQYSHCILSTVSSLSSIISNGTPSILCRNRGFFMSKF